MSALGLEFQGLYDCRRLATELHISRAAALRIMQQVPTVKIDGLRKHYVIGSDVERYLKEHTRP